MRRLAGYQSNDLGVQQTSTPTDAAAPPRRSASIEPRRLRLGRTH
jgi:hypothetical protein